MNTSFESVPSLYYWDIITENLSIGRFAQTNELFVAKHNGSLVTYEGTLYLQDGAMHKKQATLIFSEYRLDNEKNNLVVFLSNKVLGKISLTTGIFIEKVSSDTEVTNLGKYTDHRQWESKNSDIRKLLN